PPCTRFRSETPEKDAWMSSPAAVLSTFVLFSSVPVFAADLFQHGEAILLDKAVPANERGIVCLTTDERGHVYGGTSGRAAHLFTYDPEALAVQSLARLDGGIGFAHELIRLPDGSLIGGTQADPTGVAHRTDPKAVGHLYRFHLTGNGPAKVEDLGVPVAGQGIYAL